MKLDRRALLRRAGLGSMALASLPTLANAVAKPVEAAGRTNFDFVVVAKRVGHSEFILFNGSGGFNRSEVKGGGSFAWGVAPFAVGRLVASGTWKARRLLKFSPGGTFGVDQGGILDLEIRLVQESPSSAVIPATLRVVCGLNTNTGGLPEGIILTLADGSGIRFEPIDTGITIFTTGNEHEDEGRI
jgi:hypothetical protein